MKIYSRFMYYGKKLLVFLASVAVLSVLVFYIARLTPMDPLQSYYGERTEKMTVEEKERARKKLGLDAPIHVQYVRWVQGALHGDFGISYKYKQDVLGILCAAYEDSLFDRVICKLGTISSCIPEFWFSLVLILLFCVIWKILPSSGAYSIGHSEDIADRIRHLILPMTVVVLGHLWYYAYMIRNKMLEEIRADYVLLCKSEGLTRRKILMKHCVRNMLPSYISIMAISIPHILGGTYIVETVFSYPGVGTLSYESARNADYNMLMVLCMLTGIAVIFFSLLGQIINEHIDPRIRAVQITDLTEELTNEG